MSKRWFVSGTDTEAGKTVASCALLQAAKKAGYRAVGYKPVATGCDVTPEGLRNSDALLLRQYSALHLPYSQVNPLAFREPTSPHIASEQTGRPIAFARMTEGLRQISAESDWVVTEGAGGWFTPLTADLTFADWVAEQQLAVILVVGMRLGCINHALLTAQAITAAGLPFAGWIASNLLPPGKFHQPYLDTLRQRLNAPFLGEIPFLQEASMFACAGDYLRLPE